MRASTGASSSPYPQKWTVSPLYPLCYLYSVNNTPVLFQFCTLSSPVLDPYGPSTGRTLGTRPLKVDDVVTVIKERNLDLITRDLILRVTDVDGVRREVGTVRS